MSNPNNGKVIKGTEGFDNGPMLKPSGTSNGKQTSALMSEFMERMAKHTHSGADSLPASLPAKSSQIFPDATYTIVADDAPNNDLYKITLRLTNISPNVSDLAFYFTTESGIENDDWIRFYPRYVVHNDTPRKEITIYGLIRNDIKIKVSA